MASLVLVWHCIPMNLLQFLLYIYIYRIEIEANTLAKYIYSIYSTYAHQIILLASDGKIIIQICQIRSFHLCLHYTSECELCDCDCDCEFFHKVLMPRETLTQTHWEATLSSLVETPADKTGWRNIASHKERLKIFPFTSYLFVWT